MFSLPSELRSRIWARARHMRIHTILAPHIEVQRTRVLVQSSAFCEHFIKVSVQLNTDKNIVICRIIDESPFPRMTVVCYVSADLPHVTVQLHVEGEATDERPVLCRFTDRKFICWGYAEV